MPNYYNSIKSENPKHLLFLISLVRAHHAVWYLNMATTLPLKKPVNVSATKCQLEYFLLDNHDGLGTNTCCLSSVHGQ